MKSDQLVKHFQKLQDDLTIFMPLIKQNLLNYRTLESQESQQIAINEGWMQKNVEAETQFKKIIEATAMIEAQNHAKMNEISANCNTLWVKAHSKFKEIEKFIDEADRARIKKALKELETVAA